jgi:hypothetical protein
MKRNEMVKTLLNEGFSEKTLVGFSDKQLSDLHVRLFGEEKGSVVVPKGTNPVDVKKMTDQGLNVELREKKKEVGEELKGNQKKLDKNKNGKIDAEDFKLLRKKKEVKGELKGNQKKIDKNKNGKIDAEDFKLLRKKKDVKEWVENLANENFHSFTSKNEIMELIKTKLNEVEVGPNVKKGHNGIPEFMSYDAILDVQDSSTITKPAPTKPKVDPGTKPATPWSPKPGERSKPKALKEKKNANK